MAAKVITKAKLITVIGQLFCIAALLATTQVHAQSLCSSAHTPSKKKSIFGYLTPAQGKMIRDRIAQFDLWSRSGGKLSKVEIILSTETLNSDVSFDPPRIRVNPRLVMNSRSLLDEHLLLSTVLRGLSRLSIDSKLKAKIITLHKPSGQKDNDLEHFYDGKREALIESYQGLVADLLPSLIFDRADYISENLKMMNSISNRHSQETTNTIQQARSFSPNKVSTDIEFWSSEIARLEKLNGLWDSHLITAPIRPKLWSAIQELKAAGENDQKVQQRLVLFSQSLVTRAIYDLMPIVAKMTPEQYLQTVQQAIETFLTP